MRRLAAWTSALALPGCAYTHTETREVVVRETVTTHVAPHELALAGTPAEVRLHRADGVTLVERGTLHRVRDALVLVPSAAPDRPYRVPITEVRAVDLTIERASSTSSSDDTLHVEPLIVGVLVSGLVTALAVGAAISSSLSSGWDFGEITWGNP